MKRILIICAAILLALAIGIGALFAYFFVIPRRQNQAILDGMMTQFLDTLTSMDGVTIVETKAVYGKLNGNGNGIQYFGAALLQLNPTHLSRVIDALEQHFECADGWEQTGQKIDSRYLEHRSLSYDTVVPADSPASYITVCFFNSRHPDSIEWDIAGH